MGKTRRNKRWNEDDYFMDKGNRKPAKKRKKRDWNNWKNVPSEEILDGEEDYEDDLE